MIQVPSARTDTNSSAQVGAPRAPTPPRVSPGELSYLENQGRAILLHGGTEEDVVNFARLHVGKPLEERRASMVEGISESGGNPTPDDNLISGLTLKAVQGATFGFGDEAIGSLVGLLTPGQSAAEGRAEFQARLDQTSEEHPIASFLAEGAGALATGAGVARTIGLGAGIGAQALGGAAGGAAAGAGYSTGDISDRTKAALFGATFGGAIGGAGGALMSVGGAALRPAVRKVLDKIPRLQRRLPGMGSSQDEARRLISEVLDAEGLSIDQMRDAASAMRAQGIEPTIADLGGEGTLALLSQTLGSRTAAKQQLAETILSRQAEQGERLSGELFRSIFRSDKFGLENAYDAVDTLVSQRRMRAAPLYEQAHQEMMPVSDKLRTLLTRNPVLRAAWEEGKRIADSSDLLEEGTSRLGIPALPAGSLRDAAERRMIELGASEEAIQRTLAQLPDDFPSEIPIRGLDLMQRGLRKIQRNLMGRGGIDAEEFRTVSKTLETLLSEADAASPAFAQARQTYAGYSAAMDAVELGQQFMRKKGPQVQRELAALNERGVGDFYRLGAMQALHEEITGAASRSEGADIARRFFGGRLLQAPDGQDAQRIRALFDDPEVADDFMRRVVAETRLSRTTEAVGSNRPSGSRAFQNPENIGEGAIPSARMTFLLTALGAARDAAVRGGRKFQAKVSDDLAMFFSRGMDGAQDLDVFLDSLEDFQLRDLAARKFGQAFKGGISTMIGAEVGDFWGN